MNKLICPGHSYSTDFIKASYGKWLVFKDCNELSDAWRDLREVVRSGFLGATGAKCSTLRYNPLHYGAGPTTMGRIAIYTKEDDVMDVGMKLIRLPCVQQIIKYKTQSATLAMEYRHTVLSTQPVTKHTLYWNEGKPSTERARRCFHKKTSKYDSSRDLWKINVVDGASQYASERVNGYWNVSSNFEETSELNITKLWHTWKPKIEGGDIPAVKMECPGPQKGLKFMCLRLKNTWMRLERALYLCSRVISLIIILVDAEIATRHCIGMPESQTIQRLEYKESDPVNIKAKRPEHWNTWTLYILLVRCI